MKTLKSLAAVIERLVVRKQRIRDAEAMQPSGELGREAQAKPKNSDKGKRPKEIYPLW